MDKLVRVLGLLVAVSVIFTSACASKQAAPAEAGMPNPASVYCEEHGGRIKIQTSDNGGEVGICVFENGSACDEWAFYHGECQPGAGEASGAGLPNPASVYCEEHGGKLEIRTGDDGGQVGICVFSDGSACDEWAFYRGECQPGGE